MAKGFPFPRATVIVAPDWKVREKPASGQWLMTVTEQPEGSNSMVKLNFQ